MVEFNPENLKKLYTAPSGSHKGQNGKVLIIAGSKLFHAASLWPLTVASRIVDMVFYSSVPENNQLVESAKEEFRNGIVVPREKLDDYIKEADCILIGSGLPRESGKEEGDDDTKVLTEGLLRKYRHKRWVIDGGSLQTIDPQILLELKKTPILTPHQGEFSKLFNFQFPRLDSAKRAISNFQSNHNEENEQIQNKVLEMAKEFNCVILLKGEKDVVCSPFDSAQGETCVQVSGGNAGMTKGGTGDVLAGLVAALYCKNDAFLSATSASYINKKAGESLFKRAGPYFNASDLADEIPKVMKELI